MTRKIYKKANLTTAGALGENFTVTLHPLFFLFGIYYALIGKIFLFLTITISAVFHELGHAVFAKKNGYVLSSLTLMPYGASISCELEGVSNKDEILIALGGPIVSLVIAFLVTGSWWFFPDSYPYTEIIYDANLTLFLVNLLPIKPLDGGRILSALISVAFGKKSGRKIFAFLGYVFSSFLLVVFIANVVTSSSVLEVNFSILFFALFIFFGILEERKSSPYIKVLPTISKSALKRGIDVKKKAVLSSMTVKRLLALIDNSAYNEFEVVDKGILIKQDEISKNLEKIDIYSTVADNLELLKSKKY